MTSPTSAGELPSAEISRARLLPEADPRTHDEVKTVPLSLLDNTVVSYAFTGAVWYFDKYVSDNGLDAFSPAALSGSLQKTVNSYAAWAGQLHWMPYDLSRGLRHGRVAITYGSPVDPGIELIVAHSPSTLSSLLPSGEQRLADGVWDAEPFPSTQLLCPTQLALHNTKECAGLPSVSVQLTTFACGGVGIAVRITHAIADATALFQFIKDWNATHRAMLAGQPPPRLSPIFDPRLIDNAAAGDLTSSKPDPELLQIYNSLPQRRYDWWASGEGCPSPMLPQTQVPPGLQGIDLGPPGERAPWHEWDLSLPVGHHLLYFASQEVECMWREASSQQPPGARISRLDALLAVVWRLLVRARGLEHDHSVVNLITTIGLRPRISPPLPTSFIGSCLTNASTSLTAEEVTSSSTSALSRAAAAIRATRASYTPAAIGALLHNHAYEVNPQRTWRAFLGSRHVIVTSWLGNDPYGIDFGGGAPPRFVDPLLPHVDGCVLVIEGAPSASGNGEEWRWYNRAVCVSLHIAKEVLEKLSKDPELRKYA
ncbi:transferase family-domain-containing protein [Ganoderma leucocontextum]|nr:transferase family-domain-containing protein [Ganoderma leucocontextum]